MYSPNPGHGIAKNIKTKMKIVSIFVLISSCVISISETKFDISNNLHHYEVLHKLDLQHNIVKRGAPTSNHQYNHIRELSFQALGKKFRLILSPKNTLFSSNFKACTYVGCRWIVLDF